MYRVGYHEARHPVGYREARRSWLTMLPFVVLVACVPADEELPLGSAQFTITGRGSPRELMAEIPPGDVDHTAWVVHVDRFVISFKTMTIVNLRDSNQCAYRGRGAAANVLFDGAIGSVIQSFNGIKPGDCPDVGMWLGAPDDRTVLGAGGTVEDLVSLASGAPALAVLEGIASRTNTAVGKDEIIHLSLRFDVERTSTAFGGCTDAIRGAKIRPDARYALFVDIAAEAFFRDAVSTSASLRFAPFADADADGNKTVTMDELDALPLVSVARKYTTTYELPSGMTGGSFGDYVRGQFQFAVRFGSGGMCNGIAPGTPDQ